MLRLLFCVGERGRVVNCIPHRSAPRAGLVSSPSKGKVSHCKSRITRSEKCPPPYIREPNAWGSRPSARRSHLQWFNRHAAPLVRHTRYIEHSVQPAFQASSPLRLPGSWGRAPSFHAEPATRRRWRSPRTTYSGRPALSASRDQTTTWHQIRFASPLRRIHGRETSQDIE